MPGGRAGLWLGSGGSALVKGCALGGERADHGQAPFGLPVSLGQAEGE